MQPYHANGSKAWQKTTWMPDIRLYVYSLHEKCAWLWKIFDSTKVARKFPPFSSKKMKLMVITIFKAKSVRAKSHFYCRVWESSIWWFLSYIFSLLRMWADCQEIRQSSSKLWIIRVWKKMASDSFLLSFGSCSQSTPQKMGEKNVALLSSAPIDLLPFFSPWNPKLSAFENARRWSICTRYLVELKRFLAA